MNFMANRQGFYEEEDGKGKLSFSQSSSSSHQFNSLLPFNHHHHPRGWSENAAGGGAPQLELMMDTSNRSGGGAADVDAVGGRGSSVCSTVIEREHMFDKVVTPSDVGKLNRLVIPKQHAEKHFPLDSSSNEKGLLLNFEDRNGKPWRFRYSYWNSSQSYVMTKGWSRFVKEKQLDAGDIVSFHRGIGDLGKDRMFIDWRRRPDAPPEIHPSLPHQFSFHRSVPPWNPLFLQPLQAPPPRDYSHLLQSHPNSYRNGLYNYNNLTNPSSSSIIYFRSTAPQQVGTMQLQRRDSGSDNGAGCGGGGVEPMVFESVPVVHGKAASKRLRLFGVNMDCPISETNEDDILSSTTIPLLHSTMASQPSYLSSSSSSIPTYNGTPVPRLNKGKSSSLSFDLDM